MNRMSLLPPPAHLCPVCAAEHSPRVPHNRDSLYYQVRFKLLRRREPTWADAAAHCDPSTIRTFRAAAEEAGVVWTEPAEGMPIADPPHDSLHHLVEQEDALCE